MTFTIPEMRVSEPMRHNGLSVFPLFAPAGNAPEYMLSDEAIRQGAVSVKEISESGAVPYLTVENQSELRVLFLEGEELIGAKQNRILNSTVLVPARSTVKIPVSCVEQGRWRHTSAAFRSGGTHSPSKLRHLLKASVNYSLVADRGHASDQHAIWQEVARKQAAAGTVSNTSALHDTFDAKQTSMDEFYEKIRHCEGATGLAVAVGGRLVSCDFFDKPGTCKKVWKRLLSGFVLDAMEVGSETNPPAIAEVADMLQVLRELPWYSVAAVGDGEEFRAASPAGDIASTLCVDGSLIHGSLVRRV